MYGPKIQRSVLSYTLQLIITIIYHNTSLLYSPWSRHMCNKLLARRSYIYFFVQEYFVKINAPKNTRYFSNKKNKH